MRTLKYDPKSGAKRGVTLIELLVVMSVVATLIAAVLMIFQRITLQWNGQVSRSRAIMQANLGIDRMANEMGKAVVFNIFDSSKFNTFALPANTDAAGNYVPVWNAGTLQYNAGGRVQYYLAAADGSSAGNILWRRYNPNPNGNAGWVSDTKWSLVSPISTQGRVENVTSLMFIPLSTTTVFISLKVAAKENQTSTTFAVTRTVYLSNHN